MEAETAQKIDEILHNLTDLRSSVTSIREHNSSIESRLDDENRKLTFEVNPLVYHFWMIAVTKDKVTMDTRPI